MERLGSVIGGKLRIRCTPCRREGRYLVSRLVEVHGPDTSLETLRERLTVGCRWRRPTGMREHGKYEPKCQAPLIVPTITPSSLFSRAFEIDQRLARRGAISGVVADAVPPPYKNVS